MFAALLGLLGTGWLKDLLSSKLVQWGLLLGLGCLVAFAVVRHFEHLGAERALSSEQKATAAEHTRREAEIARALEKAQADVAALTEREKQRAEFQTEIEQYSRAHDNQPCLDADSVRRLDRAGQPAGGGVSEPPGPPAH